MAGLRLRQERTQQAIIHGVARLVGDIRGEQWPPEQVEVADGIEHLVLDELVGIAQTITVQDPPFIHDDRVAQATPLGQAMRPQRFDILDEAEGSGPGDFLQIRIAGEIKFDTLSGGIDRRMIERDGKVQPEAEIRV
jgi:hypothetical protein